MSLLCCRRLRSSRETGSYFNRSVLAVAVTLGLALDVGAATPLVVSNGNDSGKGSLRAALEAAAQPGSLGHILVVSDGDISVKSTLTYAGEAPLAIYGTGQAITSDVNTTLFAVTKGADLTVNNLNFRGPGGFSVKNRGDKNGNPGKGIFVKVRDDQTGTVELMLENVSVSGTAYHGIHVSDCNLGDACGAGSSGEGDGSPASIVVRFANVKISEVGTGKFDADGIRVDERGAGGIRFFSRNSTFERVGADGVELDEGQEGDAIASIINNTFAENGNYCDPEVLKSFLPKEDEGEFEDGKVSPSDIPGAVKGSPDDACFEREVELYASGSVKEYEIEIDLDDGIDIDEAGEGDLRTLMVGSTIRGNVDEGFDVGEKDGGALTAWVWRTTAEGNTDDGFRATEEGPGSVQFLLHGVRAESNGRKGATIKQSDAGDINVLVEETKTGKNGDSEKTGLVVEQAGTGAGTLTIRKSEIADGIDAENVKVVQE